MNEYPKTHQSLECLTCHWNNISSLWSQLEKLLRFVLQLKEELSSVAGTWTHALNLARAFGIRVRFQAGVTICWCKCWRVGFRLITANLLNGEDNIWMLHRTAGKSRRSIRSSYNRWWRRYILTHRQPADYLSMKFRQTMASGWEVLLL